MTEDFSVNEREEPAPAITDAQCLDAAREYAAQHGESFDAMWSQFDPMLREQFISEWRAVLECAGVSGRSPAEVPPNWPEEVQEAQKDYAAKLDRMIVCCEVLEEVEETEGLDAETIQNARDNALFATAEHQRTLDVLLAAVWRSAQQ